MARFSQRVVALINELQRRKVFRVGLLYLIVAWLVLEPLATVLPILYVSETVVLVITILAVLGFPVALVLAWAYDVTPEGIVRTSPGPDGHAWARQALVGLTLLATGAAGVAAWALWLGPRAGAEAVGEELDPYRVAVLYLDDHSRGRQLGHVADGITEDLITALERIEPLKVVSRNGVKPFRHTDIPVDSIARLLDARYLVEGSVEGDERRLKATVQLIDGRTGDHVLSEPFEQSGDSVLALRNDILQEAARALTRAMGRELRTEDLRAGTESDEAWELVERARSLQERARELGWQLNDADHAIAILGHADSLLARAETLDPEWDEPTLQRAAVASLCASIRAPLVTYPDPAALRRQIAHAERLLAREPEHPEALAHRGDARLRLQGLDPPQASLAAAREDLQRTVALDPGLPNAWAGLAEARRRAGDLAGALVAAERAEDEDPFLINAEFHVMWTLAQVWFDLGWVDRAREYLGRLYREDAEYFGGHVAAFELVALAGWPDAAPDPDSAWALLRALEGVGGQETPAYRMQVAAVLARAGLQDSARVVMRRVRDTQVQPDPWADFYQALAFVQLDETEPALDLLERFLQAMPDRRAWVGADWLWTGLHDQRRFHELVGG